MRHHTYRYTYHWGARAQRITARRSWQEALDEALRRRHIGIWKFNVLWRFGILYDRRSRVWAIYLIKAEPSGATA